MTKPCHVSSYLKLWPPNQGGCGKFEPRKGHFPISCKLVGNMSCEEVTTLFRIGSTAENADFFNCSSRIDALPIWSKQKPTGQTVRNA